MHKKTLSGIFGLSDKEKSLSVLDIGAGDARGAECLSCGGEKKVIEISRVLMDQMPRDCIPVGSDFMQANQNLGFPKTQNTREFEWDTKTKTFTFPDGEIFMQARAHQTETFI